MGSKFDYHMHSIYSDGSDTLEELLEKLKASGIQSFSLTDHDTIEGCKRMLELVPEDMDFITGIEFSCYSNGGKCHILGYGCDPENEILQAAINEGYLKRKNKLEVRLCHLKDVHGICFTEQEAERLHKLHSVGKPHLARLIVEKGLAADIDEAIHRFINGCKTENDRIYAGTAIQAILASGGVPVWAHPLGGEGEKHLKEDAFLEKLEVLMELGIQGLECYYSRYSFGEIDTLKLHAEKNHLLISGGSDYHGINKNIPLGMLNESNTQVSWDKITLRDIVR